MVFWLALAVRWIVPLELYNYPMPDCRGIANNTIKKDLINLPGVYYIGYYSKNTLNTWDIF